MKKHHLALLGALSLLCFALVLAPASLLRLLPQDALRGVDIGHLSGSIWHGRASSLRIQQYRIDKLEWKFLPSRLLTGKLALDVDAEYRQRPVSTIIALGFGPTLYLQDSRASLAATTLTEIGVVPIGQLAGDIEIELEQAQLAQDEVPLAEGKLRWLQASVTVADTARLGDVDIVLGGIDDDVLVARLSNQGGDLELNGKADVQSSGDFQVDVSLLAGNAASNNVKNSLSYFAQAQRDGSYRLQHSGNIFQLEL